MTRLKVKDEMGKRDLEEEDVFNGRHCRRWNP
mgnify:CR=1 FL=1